MKKTRKENDQGNYKKIAKSQEGITLVALVITIIIIIILATVTINMAFGNNGLITQAQLAKDMASNSTTAEGEDMNRLMQEYANVMAEDSEINPPDVTPPTDGTFSEDKGVNSPNIGPNMELVVFDDNTDTWVPDETKDGYSYVDTSTEGANTSEWANAKVTIDGIDSYFVWIPRYAYKINGENDIDIKFLQGTGNLAADGVTTCKYADDPTLNTSTDYIIHPVFTANADLGGGFGNNNGTNDNGIEGIWIGKYEASLANKADGTNIVLSTSDSTDGDILLSENPDKTIVTKPGYSSWRNCTIGKMYTNALAYSKDLESHMLKNSDWGAVAYLTESKYGRNGNEIGMNTNSSYITGGGANNAYATTNQNQSTTGNVYGIYDMRGGATERVAGYYNGSTSSDLTNNGGSFASNGGPSTKYATAYTGTSASTAYKYGDATYETSGWHSDDASFVNSDYPFFHRGGYYDHLASITGVFYYSNSKGGAYTYDSFRVSLVV